MLLRVSIPQFVSSVSWPPIGLEVSKYVDGVVEANVMLYFVFPDLGVVENGNTGIDGSLYDPNIVYCRSSQLANSDRSATASARLVLTTKLR